MRHFRSDYQRRIVDLENLIPGDEPVMVFRAQDKDAIKALEAYALALNIGRAPQHHQDAVAEAIKAFRAWPVKKVPSLPNDPQPGMVHTDLNVSIDGPAIQKVVDDAIAGYRDARDKLLASLLIRVSGNVSDDLRSVLFFVADQLDPSEPEADTEEAEADRFPKVFRVHRMPAPDEVRKGDVWIKPNETSAEWFHAQIDKPFAYGTGGWLKMRDVGGL